MFDAGELACTVTLESLASSGESTKTTIHRNVTLYLGRNEHREVQLKVSINKNKEETFTLKDIRIHKNFVKMGKASIELSEPRMRIMLANTPPDQLILFLKTLVTKLGCQKLKPQISARNKLLSLKPHTFDTISPLQLKELQTLHAERAKQADSGTPKGKTSVSVFNKGKRKREAGTDKENIQPKSGKQFRSAPKKVTLVEPVVSPVTLSSEQKRVLQAVLQGHNIFFTGSAGTGKSFLLRRIIGALAPQFTFATASTGVAACHIGGTTLHAFAGIGSGQNPLEQCVTLASRPQIAAQWKKCRHLIVDEISMVDGEFFDKLETVARVIRKVNEPFGGIQLILCGDFLQLPPVTRGKEKRKFAFQSRAWRKCIHTNFELTEVRRQSDKHFVDILQNIRVGRCTSAVTTTLQGTVKHSIEREGILATRLCTHKEDVDVINRMHLDQLTDPMRIFRACDSDPQLVKTVNALCPAPEILKLRIGAQVMLTKNLDVGGGLVNGARGVVVGFEKDMAGVPVVKFMSGMKSSIRTERWAFNVPGGVCLTRRQLPLKLAWAISIHKSQGMTLDCVEISLAKVFESGQAYVALSRAKSLEGLRVLDFNRNCVRADVDVLQFYKSMELSAQWRQVSLDDMYATQG